MKNLDTVALVLVLLGALNWGLVGLFNVNLVTLVLGTMPGAEKVVYILIGLSAVYVGLNQKGIKIK